MEPLFEEIDYRPTRLGDLILQRRRIMALGGREVYEVRLGDAYLMSSLFYASEVALAEIGLGQLDGTGWDVAVGGLGLGYTAAAVLESRRVKRLVVVEALEAVIDWHRRGLVPNGRVLTDDPRCVYHHADFFRKARSGGLDPLRVNRRFDAVLLDIDHTPQHLLHADHAEFYTPAGLGRLKQSLKDRGVFALWSNDPPEAAFVDRLAAVFGHAEGREVRFDNPLQQAESVNGVYVARCG